jgi:PAS domain S-box-containing protein
MKTDFDRLLLAEIPDAVTITTPEGEVVYWNRGAEAVFGYRSEEAVGRSVDTGCGIRPEDQARLEAERFVSQVERFLPAAGGGEVAWGAE